MMSPPRCHSGLDPESSEYESSFDWILNQVSLRSSASYHLLKVNFRWMIARLRQDDIARKRVAS